jgi:hypothetical protein
MNIGFEQQFIQVGGAWIPVWTRHGPPQPPPVRPGFGRRPRVSRNRRRTLDGRESDREVGPNSDLRHVSNIKIFETWLNQSAIAFFTRFSS